MIQVAREMYRRLQTKSWRGKLDARAVFPVDIPTFPGMTPCMTVPHKEGNRRVSMGLAAVFWGGRVLTGKFFADSSSKLVGDLSPIKRRQQLRE